ncbi:phenylacetaldehyde synthase-like isoform X2 [Castanea sativa]|uniref:phenylacetaldehyde synthase-like isoform X2 n=1 Tax=Castanea sativa TaxID=21020 RepID=UPI003F64B782
MDGDLKPMDAEQFREHAHKMVDFIADYYKTIENFPVLSQVQPGYLHNMLPDSAPNHPESLDDIFNDVQAKILPGVTHWQSPNYFAYYPSNSSIAGFLGEMLSAGLNIVGFSWITSPAATELEMIVLDWLAKLLKLPDEFLSAAPPLAAIGGFGLWRLVGLDWWRLVGFWVWISVMCGASSVALMVVILADLG